MVREIIARTVDIHRGSRQVWDHETYVRPEGQPTDDEVSDFLLSNALLDEDIVEQLIDGGLLGFGAKTATVSQKFLERFRELVEDWADNSSWLGADLPWRDVPASLPPNRTTLWIPSSAPRPSWLAASPSALLLAQELLSEGRLLSELSWKEFEDLIAELLTRDAWTIDALVRTKDGGVDVVATKDQATIGHVKALWQAKKYAPGHKVRLAHLRELSGVLERNRATKAILVTTSTLTRGALDWVRQDRYRLAYKDQALIEKWVSNLRLGG